MILNAAHMVFERVSGRRSSLPVLAALERGFTALVRYPVGSPCMWCLTTREKIVESTWLVYFEGQAPPVHL